MGGLTSYEIHIVDSWHSGCPRRNVGGAWVIWSVSALGRNSAVGRVLSREATAPGGWRKGFGCVVVEVEGRYWYRKLREEVWMWSGGGARKAQLLEGEGRGLNTMYSTRGSTASVSWRKGLGCEVVVVQVREALLPGAEGRGWSI